MQKCLQRSHRQKWKSVLGKKIPKILKMKYEGRKEMVGVVTVTEIKNSTKSND